MLTAFSYALHVLRPSKAPGFAYAWLELISNRIFIARMLHLTPQQKAWAMYAQLLIDQFRFLAPFLRNAELTKPVQLLYKVFVTRFLSSVKLKISAHCFSRTRKSKYVLRLVSIKERPILCFFTPIGVKRVKVSNECSYVWLCCTTGDTSGAAGAAA